MKERQATAAAIAAALLGTGMIGWWTWALANGLMPELQSAPLTALFHLLAEYLTAGLLLAGAVGLLRRRHWGPPLHLVSVGMLLYAVVQAVGYYAQLGDFAFVTLFGATGVLALLRMVMLLRRQPGIPAS